MYFYRMQFSRNWLKLYLGIEYIHADCTYPNPSLWILSIYLLFFRIDISGGA